MPSETAAREGRIVDLDLAGLTLFSPVGVGLRWSPHYIIIGSVILAVLYGIGSATNSKK
jgi:hypothetical protein